jgi:hypothetical protein
MLSSPVSARVLWRVREQIKIALVSLKMLQIYDRKKNIGQSFRKEDRGSRRGEV